MNPKRLWPLGLILVLTLAAGTFLNTQAANITVDTTNDVLDAAGACNAVTIGALPGPDGVTSLREAMCAANVNPGADTIEFDISGCGSGCTIQPTIALPILTDDSTTIDGYSQAGAAPATGSTAATLLIQLDGSLIANNNGFNITSTGNVIQGLVINRFPWNGVAIGGSEADSNIISGNHIGLDPTGTLDLGNGYDGIFIGLGAQNNLVGGDEPAARNVISGNEWEGVSIHGSETSNNNISGNYIGASADGLTALANTLAGVRIYGSAHNNTIGGDTPEERNIISGNEMEGIVIHGDGTTGNTVAGNHIGLTVDGLSALGNSLSGVLVSSGAQSNVIGGEQVGERNVISGNGQYGIELGGPLEPSDFNIISGNYIGVNASGLDVLPNNNAGIYLLGADGNLIGGDSEGERNVISGNLSHGIVLIISRDNEIFGNYIGLDASGQAGLPNSGNGIYLGENSRYNTIGGDTLAERNYIAGNAHGLFLEGGSAGAYVTNNLIQNNVIGQTAGFTPLGNTNDGVHLRNGAQNNTIGPGNIITYNGADGVRLDSAATFRNTITENAIYANGGLGIDLTNNANNGISPPVILSAPAGPGNVTGTACPGCTVEVFTNIDNDGEGRFHWGSAVANGVGTFSVVVSSLPFPYLTATTTEINDGTSEFSSVFSASVPVLHAASIKSVDRETVFPGGLLTYSLILTNTGNIAASARLTDTLPTELSWTDQYDASSGTVTWDDLNNRLLWNGTVEVGASVSITFQAQADMSLSSGDTITNIAIGTNGAGLLFDLHAPEVSVVVNKLYLPIIRK